MNIPQILWIMSYVQPFFHSPPSIQMWSVPHVDIPCAIAIIPLLPSSFSPAIPQPLCPALVHTCLSCLLPLTLRFAVALHIWILAFRLSPPRSLPLCAFAFVYLRVYRCLRQTCWTKATALSTLTAGMLPLPAMLHWRLHTSLLHHYLRGASLPAFLPPPPALAAFALRHSIAHGAFGLCRHGLEPLM